MCCTVLFANLRPLGFHVIRATIVFAVLEPIIWDRACNGGEHEAQRSVKSMINALASRNQAPKIMKGGEGEIAIFPADFDWQDQARVVRAISGSTSEREDDAWEALVDSCKDDRYCITTINPNEFPENWTVGDVCHRYALGRLLSVVDKHLDDIQLERQSQELRPVVIDGEFYELREWRNKHPKLKGCGLLGALI